MLQKKNIWKIQVWLWFCSSRIADILIYSSILWVSPPQHDLFWSVLKMSPKIGNFHLSYFPDNYFIFNGFRLHIWQQKIIWLTAFLTNRWYSSMFSYDADITVVNYINRDVENVFVSASDHRIFVWNLSFRVYLHLY